MRSEALDTVAPVVLRGVQGFIGFVSEQSGIVPGRARRSRDTEAAGQIDVALRDSEWRRRDRGADLFGPQGCIG